MKLRIIAALLVVGLAAFGIQAQEKAAKSKKVKAAASAAKETAADEEELPAAGEASDPKEEAVDEGKPEDEPASEDEAKSEDEESDEGAKSDDGAEEGTAKEKEDDDAPPSGDAAALETLEQKASYAIGLTVGTNIKKQGMELDTELLIKGITDVLAGNKTLLSQADAEKALTEFGKAAQERHATRAKKLGETNTKEGEQFLAANKKKKGVKTTKSGLQYRVLKEGTGKIPKLTDTVTTHYKGTLIDGTEFDSSYSRGEPASFPVNGVIAGWTEALQLMKEGSKWELVIPAKLAYGERGAGSDIGPNATLIFQIELISVD